MVQFPGSCFIQLCIHCTMTGLSSSRVTPFGYPRISGCLLLPVAFRSLPRPSSPDSSEASSMNAFSLDHILQLPLCLQFNNPLPSTLVDRSLACYMTSHRVLRLNFGPCLVARFPFERFSRLIAKISTLRRRRQNHQLLTHDAGQPPVLCLVAAPVTSL